MSGHYLRGLAASLRGVALPYGYTLTIWGSGAILSDLRSPPTVGQALLFVAGAVTAYALLKSIGRDRPSEVGPQLESPALIRAGAIHLAAMAVAIGAAAIAGLIDSGAAWPLGGFLATLAYIVLIAFEQALLEADAQER